MLTDMWQVYRSLSQDLPYFKAHVFPVLTLTSAWVIPVFFESLWIKIMGSGQVQLSNPNFQLNERENVPVIQSAKPGKMAKGAWMKSDLLGIGKKRISIIISLVDRPEGKWFQSFLSVYPCLLQSDGNITFQLLPSKDAACLPSPWIWAGLITSSGQQNVEEVSSSMHARVCKHMSPCILPWLHHVNKPELAWWRMREHMACGRSSQSYQLHRTVVWHLQYLVLDPHMTKSSPDELVELQLTTDAWMSPAEISRPWPKSSEPPSDPHQLVSNSI